MDRRGLRCLLAGHRYRFSSVDAELIWVCERGCGAGGRKQYPDPAAARRYARGFDRKPRTALGPLFGLFQPRDGDGEHRRH